MTHRRALGTLVFLAGLTALAGIARADQRSVCFYLPIHAVDRGIGEDFHTSGFGYEPAFGVQVRILRGGVEVYDGNARQNGCAVFFSDEGLGDDWEFEVIGRMTIEGPSGLYNYIYVENSNGEVASWVATLDHGDWAQFGYTVTAGRLGSLLMTAGYVLRRLPSGFHNQALRIRDAPCPTSAEANSCFFIFDHVEGDGLMRIYITGNHADRKYVIAHEVGHALIFIHGKETYGWNMYDVGYGAFGYSNAFGDLGDPEGRSAGPDCEWIADSHHLHSLESSNAAFEEGWAQFVATASWNSEEETDAFFHYYKDGADEVDMENGPLGGVTAYIRNVCDCEGDAQGASCPGDSPMKEGWGVELDWARAFWDLHTPGGNPASTPNVHLDWAEMIAVAAAAREGMDHDEAAQRVSEEMPPEMVDKWEHVAEHNGLVPEGTFGLTTGED